MGTRPAPTLETVLKALADGTRLRIVALLGSARVCVCHIHTALGVPQPTASRHLAHLKKAGLVESCRIGLWVHYCLRPLDDPRLQAVVDAVRHAAGDTAAAGRDAGRLSHAIARIPSPLQQRAKRRGGQDRPGRVHA